MVTQAQRDGYNFRERKEAIWERIGQSLTPNASREGAGPVQEFQKHLHQNVFEVQQQGRSLARKQQCGRGGRGREGQATAQGDRDQNLEQRQETNRLLRGYFSLHAAHTEREIFIIYLSQGLREPMSLKSFRIGCCSLGPWSPLLHLAVQLKLQSKLPRATSLHSLYLPHSLSSELNSKVCRASTTLSLHQHLFSSSRPYRPAVWSVGP